MAALAVAVLLGRPVSAGPARLTRTTRSVPYSVGVARCTFVDRTRGVLDYQNVPPTTLSSERTLVTEIRYPTRSPHRGAVESVGAWPLRRRGGFPMIVFAHGYNVTPDTYAPLLDAWVRAGFVVAAPFFPDENAFEVAAQHGVNTEDDLVNEPADLTFVTRQILADSATRSPACLVVHGLVRASDLALAGQSDGATVVGMLAYANGRDPQGKSYQALRAGLHYRAAVVMSGQEDGVDPYGPLAPSPALLVIQSAADQCLPPQEAVKLYDAIGQADKWFLELRDAHHLPPFDGVDVPAFRVVVRASTRFFQITLQGARPAAGLTAYGNGSPAVARMFQGASVPAIPDVSNGSVPCGPN